MAAFLARAYLGVAMLATANKQPPPLHAGIGPHRLLNLIVGWPTVGPRRLLSEWQSGGQGFDPPWLRPVWAECIELFGIILTAGVDPPCAPQMSLSDIRRPHTRVATIVPRSSGPICRPEWLRQRRRGRSVKSPRHIAVNIAKLPERTRRAAPRRVALTPRQREPSAASRRTQQDPPRFRPRHGCNGSAVPRPACARRRLAR